jgi:hypothetical protein
MGKPDPPKPPDPQDTSAAQTGTNVSTAVANAMMGNVNQVTPYGTLNYDQTGTYDFTDPYTNETYNIPTFTATQTLSPEQQIIQDRTFATQGNLAQLAQNQSQFLVGYLGNGVDTSHLPGLRTSLDKAAQYGADGSLISPAQAYQTQLGANYNTAFDKNIGGGYNTAYNQTLGKNFNQVFNKNIGGSYTDRLGSDYQTSIDLQNTYAGADDFSADRERYEDVIWGRGADDRARAEETMRTRLYNSGIREGTAGWNAEMERMARQNEDARLSAYLASGQEQSRMVGLAHQAATFGNDSTLAESNFGNNALTNKFQLQNAAALGQAQFGSQQQQAQNAAAFTNASFLRDNQTLQNSAAMGQAQFGSQQQQASNAAQLAQMAAQNQALYTDAAFQNSAQAQGMQEAYAARAQPINEIIGLMSGSQIQQPNFVNANMPTIPTTDNAGLINQNYNQQLAAYQMQQQNAGGLIGGIGTAAGALIGLSDDEAKKDKKRLGNVEDEMGLWEFRYKGEPASQPKHVGLMASEVEKVKPRAVKRGKDGLRRVDYGKALGMKGA